MKIVEETVCKDKKTLLLEIAEELFANYGFEGTSTRMIAEYAGINIAMITYYFGSKEALYASIFENRLLYIIAEIDQVDRLDLAPVEKLEAYLLVYIKRIQSNKGFYRMENRQLTMVEQPLIASLLNQNRNKAFLLLHKIITQGIVERVFHCVDVEVFALNIIYFVPTILTRPTELFYEFRFSNSVVNENSVDKRIIKFLMASLLL